MSNKKGFLQISFAWLFAIIIGAIILVFAIYAAVKLLGTEKGVSETELGEEISVLLDPLQTEFGSERTTPLSLPVESQIKNRCSSFAGFGKQEIGVAQEDKGKFEETGLGAVSYNKYVFSTSSVQGRNFYLFSKQLNLPFKVASLIFLTSKDTNYCFKDAPEDIAGELQDLGQGNLFTENCPSDSIDVCFEGDTGCNIIVNENRKSVESREGVVYYETDALMFGAIFSDKNIYECQVQRLMERIKELSLIYEEKERLIYEKGCSSDIGIELLALADEASALQDSSDLIFVKDDADSVKNKNKRAACELW